MREILFSRQHFCNWKHAAESAFTGCEVKAVDGEEQVEQDMYTPKVLPITIGKQRKAEPNKPLTPKEHMQLRALTGAPQWPLGSACRTGPRR